MQAPEQTIPEWYGLFLCSRNGMKNTTDRLRNEEIMADKKILFHINSMGKGGAERVVSVLSKYFAKEGYDVAVATLWQAEEEYELYEKVRRVHAGLSEADEKKGRLYRAVKRVVNFRSVLKKEKPDIVISFCNKANFRSAYCMAGMKTPLLVSVRNDPKRDYAPYGRSVRRMEKRAADCVFQTPDAQAFFSPNFQKKSRVIFNPLSEKYLQIKEKDTDFEREKRIVTVGRIAKQKNQLLLVKAFEKLTDKYPDMVLQIYGEDGKDGSMEGLNQYIQEKGLQNKVLFMGQCSQLETEIDKAALFVLPSDYEGMPNVLIEAMALGLPVVATDCPCGGSRLLVDQNVSGMLVNVGDEKQLTEAIDSMLSNPQKAEEMGRNARKVIDKVSPEKICGEWKSYVEELLNG